MRRDCTHLRRGPTRLLWFFFGAAAAAGWIKYNDCRRLRAAWSHHCIRSSIQLPAMPAPDTPFSWIHIPKAINDIPPVDTSAGGQSTQWSEEAESLLAFGRQAGDKVSCLFFPKLDLIVPTV
jgi:hypothetical protein